MSENEENLVESDEHASQHDEKGWADGCWVPTTPPVGWRMIKFIDDTEIGMLGLDAILADLYSQGRKADDETVEVIINRLEAKKNYIPSSERARKEYSYSLLKEYRKYIKDQTDKNR